MGEVKQENAHHTPLPGPALLKLISFAGDIEARIISLATGKTSGNDPVIDDVLERAKRVGQPGSNQADIDMFKFLMDHLEVKAQEHFYALQLMQNISMMMDQRIREAMQMVGISEVHGEHWRFSLIHNKPQMVVDPEFAKGPTPETEQYFKERTIYDLDKGKLRNDLEAGKEIKGAQLVTPTTLKAYAAAVKVHNDAEPPKEAS